MPILADPVNRSPAAKLRLLYGKFSSELHEIGKFGIIGAIAFVVDTIVFNLGLTEFDGRWLPAAVISTTVSATVAFIGNRFWTWRGRTGPSLHREYILYAFFNLVGLLISLACLFISRKVLGTWQPAVFHTRLADNIAKQGFGLVLGTAFRFWAYRRFVFLPVPADPQA